MAQRHAHGLVGLGVDEAVEGQRPVGAELGSEGVEDRHIESLTGHRVFPILAKIHRESRHRFVRMQAVKSAGKLGKIKLIGNGGSCQAVKGVLAGTWFASYIIAERSSGAKATELGIKAANGQKVPHSFNTEQLQNPLGTKQVIQKTHFKAQYCD